MPRMKLLSTKTGRSIQVNAGINSTELEQIIHRFPHIDGKARLPDTSKLRLRHPLICSAPLEAPMKSLANLLRKTLRNPGSARTRIHAAILLLAALAALPCVGAAQALYGTIIGTVTDKTGAVVPNVSVTVKSQDTGAIRTTSTGPQGDYQVPNLLPGTYTITLQSSGFAGFTQENIAVEVNRQARIDATLQAAGVTQTVTVTQASPILQTETAEVNHEITSEQIAQLPVTSSQ